MYLVSASEEIMVNKNNNYHFATRAVNGGNYVNQ